MDVINKISIAKKVTVTSLDNELLFVHAMIIKWFIISSFYSPFESFIFFMSRKLYNFKRPQQSDYVGSDRLQLV